MPDGPTASAPARPPFLPPVLPLSLLAALVLLPGPGCTQVNRPLNDLNVALEARRHNHTRALLGAEVVPLEAETPRAVAPDPADAVRPDVLEDGVFVGVAISGGGSRSANFAAACFFQLQRIGLLRHADYISSVSGGSLTAAYYCTHGDGPGGWNPEAVQKKFSYAFANEALVQTLLPWNSVALMFSDLDRTDIIAGAFDRQLFQRPGGGSMTFADLRPDRPRVLINATDLQSGKKFIFCNETFDELNSDLSKYPLAHAVAASSAVPVLLHQVTLRDYSTVWKQYRHLVDGGVVDNLGVQSLVEVYAAHVAAAAAARRPDPYPGGAVLIVIDARTEFDASLSDRGDIGLLEGLVAGAGLTSTALLNRASTATLAEIIVRYAADNVPVWRLRDWIRTLNDTGSVTVEGRNGKPVRVVHLALSQLEDVSNLPSSSFRERVNSIATYFNISSAEAFNLYKAAELLVQERYGKELNDLAAYLDRPPALRDKAK